jgi:hypothetical protein
MCAQGFVWKTESDRNSELQWDTIAPKVSPKKVKTTRLEEKKMSGFFLRLQARMVAAISWMVAANLQKLFSPD